jgi:hypothetical protein
MFGISWTNVQKFCFENFTVILLTAGITSVGGILAGMFSWVFAIFVPWWIALVAFAMKNEYKKKM